MASSEHMMEWEICPDCNKPVMTEGVMDMLKKAGANAVGNRTLKEKVFRDAVAAKYKKNMAKDKDYEKNTAWKYRAENVVDAVRDFLACEDLGISSARFNFALSYMKKYREHIIARNRVEKKFRKEVAWDHSSKEKKEIDEKTMKRNEKKSEELSDDE